MGTETGADTGIVWCARVLGLPSTTSPTSQSEFSAKVANFNLSLHEICQLAINPNPELAAPYLSGIDTIFCTHQNEMLLVANSLLASLATSVHPNAPQLEQSFLSFLSRHARTLEGLNIIAQVIRSWPESFMQATQPRASCIAHARRGLSTPLHALTCNVSDALRAYTLVLVRALESPLVCEAASSAIETTLRGVIPNQAAHRKALAGAVLQALRHMPNYPELRRLASFVFTADGTSGSEASSLRLGAVSGSGAPVTTAVKQQLALDRLSGPDGNTYAERLTANDFQQLRQVTGLSLESFKAVTDRIRLRATSESWARAAILDLARAPHALEVTTSIRTAALGALVSEARRLGRLTPQIEKEIFAVSAEIPTLPHLGEAVWSVNSEHHS